MRGASAGRLAGLFALRFDRLRAFGGEEFGEASLIVSECLIAVFGVALHESSTFAFIVGSNVAQEQPVVPLAAGLLDLLVAAGELLGGGEAFRESIGHVTAELGGLAQAVERVLV